MNNEKRVEWTDLRLESYISGRRLIGDGMFHVGLMVMGYAVEYSLKHALYEFNGKIVRLKDFAKIKYSHNLSDIYKYGVTNGLFKDILVSDDFLKYITDNFDNYRYPEQIIKNRGNILKDGRAVSAGCYYINYYDDLIIQIDNHILKNTNNPDSSIGFKALCMADDNYSVLFFSRNIYAFLKLDYYNSFIKEGGLPSSFSYTIDTVKEKYKDSIIKQFPKSFFEMVDLLQFADNMSVRNFKYESRK